MEINIRQGVASDADAIVSLWIRENQTVHSFVTMDWQEAGKQLRRRLGDTILYLAEENGTIAGYLGVQGEELVGLFIADGYRGMGIGRALLSQCKKTHDVLRLECYAKNSRACRFYEREGFLVTGAEMSTASQEMKYQMEWNATYDSLKEKGALEYAE